MPSKDASRAPGPMSTIKFFSNPTAFPPTISANVVDDRLMKITHVIRGDEWMSSTPKHILSLRMLWLDAPDLHAHATALWQRWQKTLQAKKPHFDLLFPRQRLSPRSAHQFSHSDGLQHARMKKRSIRSMRSSAPLIQSASAFPEPFSISKN